MSETAAATNNPARLDEEQNPIKETEVFNFAATRPCFPLYCISLQPQSENVYLGVSSNIKTWEFIQGC